MTTVTKRELVLAHNRAYAQRIVVVPTRYQGCYEGGRFAAITIDDLCSSAFGQDCEAADWWSENEHRVGVGATPSDALADWFSKSSASDALSRDWQTGAAI